MKNIIPGHMRAITWVLALVVAVGTYLTTHRLDSVVGSLILVLGFFLTDQATHLAQEDHASPPSSWIERMLQKHTLVSVVIGTVLVAVGTILMTTIWFWAG